MNTKERTYLRPKRRKTRRLGPFLPPPPNLLLLVRLGGVWTHCGGRGTRRCGGRGRGRGGRGRGRGCRCGCMYRDTHHVSPVTAIDASLNESKKVRDRGNGPCARWRGIYTALFSFFALSVPTFSYSVNKLR
jgi:hypothetical protein